MATKGTVIESGEFTEVVRKAVSGMTSGDNVSFFKVMNFLAVDRIHCGRDELLAVLASLCPMVLAAEIYADGDGILVRFRKV